VKSRYRGSTPVGRSSGAQGGRFADLSGDTAYLAECTPLIDRDVERCLAYRAMRASIRIGAASLFIAASVACTTPRTTKDKPATPPVVKEEGGGYRCTLHIEPASFDHATLEDGTIGWVFRFDAAATNAMADAHLYDSKGERLDMRLQELGCAVEKQLKTAALCPAGWRFLNREPLRDGELLVVGACKKENSAAPDFPSK